MPTLHIPSSGGGLRAHEVRAGRTLAATLREQGLLTVAAQRGVEIKTPTGWERVRLSRVLRAGDVVRMREPGGDGGGAGERVAAVLKTIVGALKRRKVPDGTARSGVRGRRGHRPGAGGPARPPRK